MKREDQFILHCKTDIQFMKLMKSKYPINNNNKQPIAHSENENKNNNQNEYGIPWKHVKFYQLPLLYKVCLIIFVNVLGILI